LTPVAGDYTLNVVESAAPSPHAAGAKSAVLSSLAKPVTAVWAASLVWLAIFLTISIRAYRAFLDHRFDLGNMTQAVWSTAHGRPFESTELTGRQIIRLGAHVDPILALFAPLWRIWPSPVMLLSAQIFALASGAIPVFWLGRKYLPSERAAAYMAFTYLLYPGLQWRALNEFYPSLIAVPLVLFAIWYLDEDKLWRFAVFGVLVAASQEQMGLLIGGLGLWYGLRRRRWRVASAISTVGFAWTAVAMFIVIPHFSGGSSPFYSRYAAVGGSPLGILRTSVTDPISVLSAATTPADLRFLFWSFVPLLGLFIFAPTLAAIALPQLALSLLSDRSADVSLNGNISAPLIPIFIAGSVLGIARFRNSEALVRVVVLVAGLCAIAGPLPHIKALAPAEDANARAADAAVSLIPANASVSATNDLGSHLSARWHIYQFPLTEKSEWVVVDLRDQLLPSIAPREARTGLAVPREDLVRRPARFGEAVRRLERDPSWRLAFSRGDIRVWRRASATNR
jgi:uncharacterized membrane protein